jgi:RNA polymerase sigma-70 factor, ECF subfamily
MVAKAAAASLLHGDDRPVLICEGSMPPTDEECVRSCLDGHPEDYRHLLARYQVLLLRRLHHQLGNLGDATEAAQETFVRAYFALGALRKPEAFFSWLFGISDRVVKETRRAALRRRTVDLGKIEPAAPVSESDAVGDEAVAAAVTSLPDAYREVVLLRFFGGRSCAEIGRDLGVPLGTVTKRLSRAYALLRDSLGTEHGDRGSEAPQ